MKKIKSLIALIIFFIGLISLSSCYTKKQGIVPCPTHGYNNTNIENVDIIPSEKV